MTMREACLGGILLLSAATPLLGEDPPDENSDLALIPSNVATRNEAIPRKTADPGGKLYLEDALTGWTYRSNLSVPAPTSQPSYQDRLSLDADSAWRLSKDLKLGLSDRLNGFAADRTRFPSAGNARNDFREGYVSWEAAPDAFLEAGRINLKNGVALGYNPSDFFKTRTTVDIVSIDPSVAKENRLGVGMVKGQALFERGSVTVAYAPGLRSQSPLMVQPPASLDPLFGQTNSTQRLLAGVSCEIFDLSPQALVYHDDVGTHFAASLSRSIATSFVVYAEWAGVREADLSGRATAFGKSAGQLSAAAAVIPQTDPGESFRNDAAAGLSWTNGAKMTVNLEYHFHQAGFDRGDFDRWIALGGSNRQLAAELWYVRQYAADQQEPLMQQELFLRFDWQDALINYLDLGAVAFVSPYDGSLLAQSSAQYFVSKNWTIAAYLGGTFGSPDTVQGSIPWNASAALQLTRYF